MRKKTNKLSTIWTALLPDSKISNETALNKETLINRLYEKYFEQKVHVSTELQSADNDDLQRQLALRTNLPEPIAESTADVWIFGYGSLIWKADFPYIDRRRGYICGYQRRFYQHSIDHRGTHSKPGRVVTLLPTANSSDRVYGMAYRIAAAMKADVLTHLDYREQNGYERCALQFQEFPEATGAQFDVIMYIATKDNVSYAGDVWQLARIAEQIFTSAGPSGRNREYLFNLARAVRVMFPGVNDAHLFDLEAEVLKRIRNDEAAALDSALRKEIGALLAHVERDYDECNAQTVEKLDFLQQFQLLQQQCNAVGWQEALLTKELLL